MTFFQCLSLQEAQQRLHQAVGGRRLPVEAVPLAQAAGRVLAAPVLAQEAVPAFARATVDGFAVNSADTFAAGEGGPVWLQLAGSVQMGWAPDFALAPGEAAHIPTGGMLPDGADAVVMVEHTEQPDDASVLVLHRVVPGENRVEYGEDLQPGQAVLEAGCWLDAAAIGALAACGCQEVSVYARPRVAVVSTGDEVVPATAELYPGQVRDVNGPALTAQLQLWGCEAVYLGIVPDQAQQLEERLRAALGRYEVILISGGSSVGGRDHTQAVLERLAPAGLLFHGLTLKPGKPTLCAAAEGLLFGLPGHPVAALTVCRLLVLPVLRWLSGRERTLPQAVVPATMGRSVASAPGRDDFLRVRLRPGGHGWVAEPVLGKSGLIRTLAQADGLVHVAAPSGGLEAGQAVEVLLLPREEA